MNDNGSYGYYPINIKSFYLIMPKDINYQIYMTIDGEDIPFSDSRFIGKSLDYFDDWVIHKVHFEFREWTNPDGDECKGLVCDVYLTKTVTITAYPNPDYDLKAFEEYINRTQED